MRLKSINGTRSKICKCAACTTEASLTRLRPHRKVAIALSEKIPALYARLFFNEQELESGQTMASINILPGDRLEVYREPIDDQNLDLTKLDDSIDKNTRSRGKKAKPATREEGFQKTGLTGWDTPGSETEGHVTEPSEDVEMAPITVRFANRLLQLN